MADVPVRMSVFYGKEMGLPLVRHMVYQRQGGNLDPCRCQYFCAGNGPTSGKTDGLTNGKAGILTHTRL